MVLVWKSPTPLWGHDAEITGMCSISAAQWYKSSIHTLYSGAVFRLSIQYLDMSWYRLEENGEEQIHLANYRMFEHRTCTVVSLRSCHILEKKQGAPSDNTSICLIIPLSENELWHETAAFSTEQCNVPSLFTTSKSSPGSCRPFQSSQTFII